MSAMEANNSQSVSKETEESKLKQLAELYRLRDLLEREKMRLRSQSCGDRIRNAIDLMFVGFNKRAMAEFDKKVENKRVKDEYRANLEEVNTFYDNQIKEFTDNIKELRDQRQALVLSQKASKDTIRRMQKSIAQYKVKGKDGSIDPTDEFGKLLDFTKKQTEELKKAQQEIKASIETIDKAIAEKEASREKAYNDRDAKIQELQNTKETSLQKRSFVSRIIALFGGGAKARAEALAQRIEDRNQATKDAKSQLDLDYKEAEQAIKQQKDEIKQSVENSINNMKNAVVGFGKNVAGFGEKVLEYVGATFDLIGASAKGSLQNVVKKVFDRMREFSSQEAMEATGKRIEKARNVLKGDKKGNENQVADMEQ